MVQLKYILFGLLLLCSFIEAQPIAIYVNPSSATIESKSLGTFVQATSTSDSVYIVLGEGGIMSIEIDTVYTLNDTVGIVYTSTLEYQDTLWCYFDVDLSTQGAFSDSIIVGHTGYDQLDTSVVTYSVYPSDALAVETPIAFGTIATSTVADTVTLTNNAVGTLVLTNFFGLDSPFEVGNTTSSIAGSGTHDITISAYALANDSYTDSLFIGHMGAEILDTIIVTATVSQGATGPEALVAPTYLTATSTVDTIDLSCTMPNLAEYLIWEHKYSGASSWVPFDTTSVSTTSLYNILSVQDSIRVKATNNYDVSDYSSIITATRSTSASNYLIVDNSASTSIDGSGVDTASSIGDVMDYGQNYSEIYFKGGQTFTSQPFSNVDGGSAGNHTIYSAYGSATKPILGDSTSSFPNAVIQVSDQYVTLEFLHIVAYNDGIVVTANNVTIKDCYIKGSSYTTDYQGDGINANLSGAGFLNYLNVLNNEVETFGTGMLLIALYNSNISGNEIHDIYYTGGSPSSGGQALRVVGGADGDGNYRNNVDEADYTVYVSYNDIYDFERDAMDGVGMSELIFEYNTIHDSYPSSYDGTRSHGRGIKVSEGWYDTDAVNFGTIVRYNKFYDLNGASDAAGDQSDLANTAIYTGQTYGMWIYGNLIYNVDGTGIYRYSDDRLSTSGTTPSYFFNNTILCKDFGVYIDYDALTSTYIANNIISSEGSAIAAMHSSTSSPYDYMGHNIIVQNSGSQSGGYLGHQYQDDSVDPDSALWYRGTQPYSYGTMTNLEDTDPMFADTSSQDFNLTSSSINAIDAGYSWGADPSGYTYIKDIDGNPIGTAIDIGAFEYVEITPTVVVDNVTITPIGTGDSVIVNAFFQDGGLTCSAYLYWQEGDSVNLIDDIYSTMTVNQASNIATDTVTGLTIGNTYYHAVQVFNDSTSDYSSTGTYVAGTVAQTTYTDTLDVLSLYDDWRLSVGASYGEVNITENIMGDVSGATYKSAYRFYIENTIESNATIDTCYLIGVATYDLSGNDANTYLSIGDTSNASGFTYGGSSVYNAYLSRARTDSVAWNAIASWTDGTTYSSPDLSDELQTVITNQGGLTAGNYIAVYEDGKSSTTDAQRRWAMYGHATDEPVRLVIKYTQ